MKGRASAKTEALEPSSSRQFLPFLQNSKKGKKKNFRAKP